jgi:hypothetical protein
MHMWTDGGPQICDDTAEKKKQALAILSSI